MFHRFHRRLRRLSTPHHHLVDERSISVPEPGLSPYALRRCGLCGGRSFLKHLRCSKAVHQLTSHQVLIDIRVLNKDFGLENVILRAIYLVLEDYVW